MTTLRRYGSTLLKIAVTVLGLAFVLSQIELQEIADTLLQAQLGWFVISFGLILASMVVRAYRWFLLLRGLGLVLPIGRLVALYFVGSFFNAFLPTSFGGDVMRVVEVARDVPTEIAAGTVILDRLTGLMMLFVMALLALPFRPPDFPPDVLLLVVVASIVGLIAGLILLEGGLIRRFGRVLPTKLSPTGTGPVAKVLSAVNAVGWRAIGQALGISLIFNFVLVLWWWTAGQALGFTIPFVHYLLVIPILSISLLVPSIGGLGPREVVAPTLFASQIADGQAVALSLLVLFLQRLPGIIGGPIYLWMLLRGKTTPVPPNTSGLSDAEDAPRRAP